MKWKGRAEVENRLRSEGECRADLCMVKCRAWDSEKDLKDKSRPCKGKMATLKLVGQGVCREDVDAAVSVTALFFP